MLARLAAIILVLFAIPAAAQTPASVAGSWALQFEGTSIFRFDIEQDGDKWKGTWWRPRTFAPGEKGDTFYGVSGPPVEVPSADDGHAIAEWTELTFPDNRPGAIPDVFRFRLIGPDRAAGDCGRADGACKSERPCRSSKRSSWASSRG